MNGAIGAVSQLIDARTAAAQTHVKVQTAVARKQADATAQQGDAMVDLLRQAVEVQKQLAAGQLDVRV